MNGRVFVDTNLWIYSVDNRDSRKHELARHAIRKARDNGHVVISSQVKMEFVANLIRKMRLPPSESRLRLGLLDEVACVSLNAALVDQSLELLERHSISIWDAAILACALEAGCDLLLTEDMQHGQQIGSLRIVNPFFI